MNRQAELLFVIGMVVGITMFFAVFAEVQ